ncbi:VanW family protein [Mesobacillus jeotgali]|uniref:VanW family protein n=1 Tax=Mesobacillus jeotgali TaxID=129985 RepID=UPI001591E5F4|nr:VanW family protein [Mesobacillus jeotgali]
MRKQQIIKFSLILSVFTVFIFSFSYYGVPAFGSLASSNQTFTESTYIGTVDVSNKTHEQAKAVVEAKVNEWLSSAKISLVYKGEIYDVDPSKFIYLVDESVADAKSGTQNELYVEMNEGILSGLSLPETTVTHIEKEMLMNELRTAGQRLAPSLEISLENFLPEEEPVTISQASIDLPEDSNEIKELMKVVQKIEIASESQVSLANTANEKGLIEKSSFAFSQIASAIYKAILPTNFAITERHISSQLAGNIELGFESKVDFANNLDLKFYNPNKSAYRIELAIAEEKLQVTVKGAPLLYEYKIATSGKQEFKPRTIKQYSPLLQSGQKSVEKEGKSGFVITVSREKYVPKGELLESLFVSEDFYRPEHRVEILPVAPAVQQTSPSHDSTGTVTGPSGNQSTTTVLPGVPAGDNSITPDQDHINDSPGQDATTDTKNDGGLWGKPNEEPK